MTLEITVSNVGGIDHLETSFESGTTLIAAPNASNKTSLLKAIAFGLGAEDVPIRSGSSTAKVTLTIGEKSVTRAARRRGVGKELTGEPWLDDEEVRSQFTTVAALLEFNDLRTAVRHADDIEAALKAPIDFDALEARQSTLLEQKQTKRRERESLADADDRLDAAIADREDARDRRADLEATLDELERKREPETVDDRIEALRERRTELHTEREQVREQIEATHDALDRYRERRSELTEEIDRIESEREETDLQTLRERRSQLESDLDSLRERVDVLQSVLTANRDLRTSAFTGILGSEHRLDGDEVTCWTCGQPTELDAIDETLEELQSRVTASKQQVRAQEPEVEEIDESLQAARKTNAKLDQLRGDRRDLEDRIAERERSLETQQGRLADLEDELAAVSDDLDERRREQVADDAELADDIEQTRLDLQAVERDIERLDATIEDRRADVDRHERLGEEIEDLTTEIQTLTERLETMEQQLRTQFNDAMDDLLRALDFDRIQRVWLDGEFDIVVAREVDGTVQQDSVSNLAESERELIGLVLGLAGYLAYDLHAAVPVLLLDSLGALDNERVARLVEYFRDVPEFLIAAVHPDTADALGDGSSLVGLASLRQ